MYFFYFTGKFLGLSVENSEVLKFICLSNVNSDCCPILFQIE